MQDSVMSPAVAVKSVFPCFKGVISILAVVEFIEITLYDATSVLLNVKSISGIGSIDSGVHVTVKLPVFSISIDISVLSKIISVTDFLLTSISNGYVCVPSGVLTVIVVVPSDKPLNFLE